MGAVLISTPAPAPAHSNSTDRTRTSGCGSACYPHYLFYHIQDLLETHNSLSTFNGQGQSLERLMKKSKDRVEKGLSRFNILGDG